MNQEREKQMYDVLDIYKITDIYFSNKHKYEPIQIDRPGKRDESCYHTNDSIKCLRQRWYAWKDKLSGNDTRTSKPNGPTMLKWELGNLVEQEFFYKALYVYMKEGYIKDFTIQNQKLIKEDRVERGIIITPDTGVKLNDGREIIAECKSSHGRNVTELKHKGLMIEIIKQVYQYCYYFDKPAWVPYIARDSGYMDQFYAYNKDGFYIGRRDGYKKMTVTHDKMVDRLVMLETALKDDQVPDMEYKACWVKGEYKSTFTSKKAPYKSNWQCDPVYCSYSHKCWNPANEGKWYCKERIE